MGETTLSYLQCLVPAAGHDAAVVWGFNPVNRFDGAIVLWRSTATSVRWFHSDLNATTMQLELSSNLCNLHGLVAVEIPHLGCFVTGCGEDFAPVLLETAQKKWLNIFADDALLLQGFSLLSGRTSLQHVSNTGPVCICWALGTVWPLSCTSQQRTWHQMTRGHSQSRARRRLYLVQTASKLTLSHLRHWPRTLQWESSLAG